MNLEQNKTRLQTLQKKFKQVKEEYDTTVSNLMSIKKSLTKKRWN